jgi:hypothetical protein
MGSVETDRETEDPMNQITRTERRRRRLLPPTRNIRLVVASAAAVALVTLLLPMSGAALPQAAPANTSPPTITGTAAKGQTLVASSGSWSGTTPINFTFAWQRCDSAGANCSTISGATSTTYVLASADVGARMRVLVTASNAEGSASALSEATSVVADDSSGAPKNTGEPTISGTPRVGQQLTGTTGTWTGTQPIAYALQWVRCPADGGAPDGSNCANISGATGTSYVLVSADVGLRIRLRVTASNSVGAETAASNPTSAVQAATSSKPVNTRAPSISGAMTEGSVLTANRGTWTGATPITYSYQWLRCNAAGGSCAAIRGATGTQYRLTSNDVGRKVRLNVTARNSAGSTTAISGEYATVTPSGPSGVITLPSGEKSIPASSVPRGERLIVSRVQFAPNPVRSRTEPFSVQVRVKDTRGYVVRDALVFIRSTPLVTTAQPQSRKPTLTDGWVAFQMTPRFNFPEPRNGYNVQFFVKAYRAGDPELAGIAGYRLVQVRLAG